MNHTLARLMGLAWSLTVLLAGTVMVLSAV